MSDSRFDNDITPVPHDKEFVPEGAIPYHQGKSATHKLPDGVIRADSYSEEDED